MVEGDRIAFVGDEAPAIERAGEGAGVVDLAGGVALPGFVDGHAHVLMTGASLLKAQLRTAVDLDEIRQRLLDWRAANPAAPRVLGISWQFSAVPDGRPTKEMLDDLFPDVPVYLDANDLHSSWVNSAALRELGIDDSTPDPIGGEIVRDPLTGEATGHLQENAAVNYVWALLARAGAPDRRLHLDATMAAYNTSGVTTCVDMAFDEAGWATARTAELEGALTLRIVGHWFIDRDDDPEVELAQVARAAELAASDGESLVRVAGIKCIVDGTIDGCTAALLEPYTTGANCEPIWDAESLTRVVVAADAAGLQVALHAIGDRAVRIALDAIEHAQRVNPPRERRHRVEHLEYVDAADIPRLAPLGVTASMQPVHIDPAIYSNWGAMLGDPRAQQGFAWREFLTAGTTLAFGTDTPTAPHDPLENMYIASTRKSPSSPELPPHRPDNALPLDQAIGHATRDSAWASFLDSEVGMLREGMMADIVILDSDPFDGPPDAILRAQVVATYFGGREVVA